MKILMLTLYLPFPPTSGGQIRSFNLIKNLSKNHEITLVSIIKKGEEKYAAELEKYCSKVLFFYRSSKPWAPKNIARAAISLFPFLVIRNTSIEARKAIEKLLKNQHFDLIHVETFYLMPHIPKTKIPILLVDQTIEFQVYQHFVESLKKRYLKPFLNLEVMRLKFWETKFWRQANKVVAVSETDAEMMKKYVPGLEVGIIPNAPGDDLADLYNKRGRPNFTEPVIFFQSNFLWLQNVEGAEILAKQVFPEILKTIPNAMCKIVGQNTRGKIENLQGDKIKVNSLETSDIDGIRQAYLTGTVFVAPLWGPGGTRLKILSAMSTGVPVVTTSVGAAGIDVTDGLDIIIRDDPVEMAKAVVEMLKNPKRYDSIVKNARALIQKRYDWKIIAKELGKLYEETARKN